MQRRRVLFSLLASLSVLFISGIAVSGPKSVSGPVQVLDYDSATELVQGLPSGLPPLSSFARDVKTVELPADLSLYPPTPCAGVAQVWNAVQADSSLHGFQRREVFGLLLQVMASNQCGAEIERDSSSSPPNIITITPTASF